MERQTKSKADREVDAMVQRVLAVAALLVAQSDDEGEPTNIPSDDDDHEA